MIGLFYDDVLKVREKVKAQAPEVTEVIGLSHDHEGPDTMGLWGPTPFRAGWMRNTWTGWTTASPPRLLKLFFHAGR